MSASGSDSVISIVRALAASRPRAISLRARSVGERRPRPAGGARRSPTPRCDVPAAAPAVHRGEALVQHEAAELVDESRRSARGMKTSGSRGRTADRPPSAEPLDSDDARPSRISISGWKTAKTLAAVEVSPQVSRQIVPVEHALQSAGSSRSHDNSLRRRVRMAYSSPSVAGIRMRCSVVYDRCARPRLAHGECRSEEAVLPIRGAGRSPPQQRLGHRQPGRSAAGLRARLRLQSGGVESRRAAVRAGLQGRALRSCGRGRLRPQPPTIAASTTRSTATPTTCSRSWRPLDAARRRVRRPLGQRHDRRARREPRPVALRIARARRALAAVCQRRRLYRGASSPPTSTALLDALDANYLGWSAPWRPR